MVVVALTAFEVWTYRDCLDCFFHFDDFWVLAAAARIPSHSLRGLLRVFEPVHGFLLYRPLSTVLYFFTLHEAFGYDPVGYHATQLAFHILNGVLVYAIADSILFSRPLAAAAALIYVTAPGHAIAVCWVALFTMTGTAFFYFVAVWVWVRLDSRWRVPLTLLLFGAALLASEHAVSLPLTLTAASLLLTPQRDWRRSARELAAFYAIGASYVAAKLYYLHYGLAGTFPNPAAQIYVASGYHVSLAPVSILLHLGRYCEFTVNLIYNHVPSDAWALALGVAMALAAIVATLCVLSARWTTRPLRAAAFGLDVFIIGLAPVLVLPAHLYSYYVGIAAMGMAVAIVGFGQALPRPWVSRLAPWGVVALLLAVHVGSTAALVRQSDEFTFLRGFSENAARWLYTLRLRAEQPGIDEVVLPSTGLTDMVFNVGEAHRLFLCAHYRVQTARNIQATEPAANRLILLQSDRLPPWTRSQGRWFWLQPCRDVR